MKGEDNYSETEVTIGSETKSSFMDNLLDGIGGLFGRDLKADRIERRNNALKAVVIQHRFMHKNQGHQSILQAINHRMMSLFRKD